MVTHIGGSMLRDTVAGIINGFKDLNPEIIVFSDGSESDESSVTKNELKKLAKSVNIEYIGYGDSKIPFCQCVVDNGGGQPDVGIKMRIVDMTGFAEVTDTPFYFPCFMEDRPNKVAVKKRGNKFANGNDDTANANTNDDSIPVSVIAGEADDGNNFVDRPIADLVTVKTVTPSNAAVGDMVTYTITVTNNGPAEATNILLYDRVPGSLESPTVTTSQGAYSTPDQEWNIGTLANGDSVTMTMAGTVGDGSQGGIVSNKVYYV